jgi:hypothetical protein
MSEVAEGNGKPILQSTPKTETPPVATASKPKGLSRFDLIEAINAGFGEKSSPENVKHCNKVIQDYLKQIVAEYPDIAAKYNILILNDSGSIVPSDADKIYNAVTRFDNNKGKPKPILLILYSNGGYPGSAYLIGKLCLEFSNDNLVVTIPRYAKSAATLLCCAANEIHMGSLSELGPIDPQINDMPALGLKNAVQHIAELVKSNPASSLMFANYLHLSLPLIDLGYYERAAESAKQYAEQLLNTHSHNLPADAESIAHDLVYKYKDHGFVIEKVEATKIFGDIIKTNTTEYELGNKVYQALDYMRVVGGIYSHNFYFIGSLDSDPNFTKRQTVKKTE